MLGGRSRERGGGAGDPAGMRDRGGRGVRALDPGESGRSDDASVDRESTDDEDSVDEVYPIGGAAVTGLGGGICISGITLADGSRTSSSSNRNWKSSPNSCKS